MTKLTDLHSLGQSLWYDNIARDLLRSGDIQRLVDEGVMGLTSNPAIFKNAITNSSIYDDQIRELALQGKTAEQIYEVMAVDDIRAVADILRPIYERTDGVDGYVSLEVSPYLARDTEATLAEAKRLFDWVDRPNLMIKIPATQESLPAVEEALVAGLNINVTLIFSLKVYSQVMEVYLTALERRAKAGLPVRDIASVASFFVSRVDTLVDQMLDERIAQTGDVTEQAKLKGLQGKAAVANAKLAYQLFGEIFGAPRFDALKDQGACVQRPLWASTSTKNPDYRDVIYIEELIGPDTVNTAPPQTIDAFRDHGRAAVTIRDGWDASRSLEAELADVGIDLDAVTEKLLVDGLAVFVEPFQQMLDAIEEKRRGFVGT
ncbi:MAG: transaldolase [Anaerolineae bacterium]|nr:transaldolase [Anaerolineae bacterium]